MFWNKRTDDRVTTLAAVPELEGWAPAELREVGAQFDEIDVPSGAVLARPGRGVGELLVVAAGCLQVIAPSGTYTLGPGSSWGWPEMAGRLASEARVVAATDAKLLVMGRAQFRAVAGRWRAAAVEEAVTGRRAS